VHNPSCRACGHASLVPVLSLGATPLANALLRADQLNRPEPRFPLDAVFCPVCALFQITETVPPETLFRTYVYLSSFSDAAVANARDIVGRTVRARRLGAGSLAVEIASNDGYLLSHYVTLGVPVLGPPIWRRGSAALTSSTPTTCSRTCPISTASSTASACC